MHKETLQKELEQARHSTGYKNYLTVRDAVFRMLDHEAARRSAPSEYYQEESQGFGYLFDASPLVIKNLRHHCHHMTGVREYEYRPHHQIKRAQYEHKLALLQQEDRQGLFVPEAREFGGFGFDIRGGLVNSDTLKFYECMLALEKGGALAALRDSSVRHTIVEIGAGWGGLPYMLKRLFPNTTYIIVDLPTSFLFGATYLMTLFPDARVLMDMGDGSALAGADLAQYDFVFVPYYLWEELMPPTPTLVLNTVAFQEMGREHIAAYLAKAKAWGVPFVYSMNRDRSPYNTNSLSTVGNVMSEFYDIREIKVISVPIHNFSFANTSSLWTACKRFIKWIVGRVPQRSIHEYRHLMGYARH